MYTSKPAGIDFLEKLNRAWYEDAANSHLDSWRTRYSNYDSIRDVEFDLKVNHDISLEVEYAEETIGRKINDSERSLLKSKFIDSVINKLNKDYVF